ncbi:hypothetical protein [Streptomyces sp. BA2]|uniref:hypothetical protein n=1 Tax=Streptomyces sp. BA2 TaxID=436595 RepID=UPI00132A2A69|nr:hypothetical protein [Streptomyces sp. BA2]MWA08245.1 hypothetical protein [Streptomyces sp. BA2]
MPAITERLIASGELDVYHAARLTRCGYRGARTSIRYRELVAAEGRRAAMPPEHPLTLKARQFTREEHLRHSRRRIPKRR